MTSQVTPGGHIKKISRNLIKDLEFIVGVKFEPFMMIGFREEDF